ncbi:hypothetical protein PSTEL_07010 [Paenibacillus stellifer]|uniref:PKD domain-containing protein n=1 Tax=Paenibacillus stellifer TaxID=169760 RepID=A0A089LPY6_9BACL|nr:hypothetical protein [Paenibacillus stellifer]AIQ62892.1 hypothetical protein PSTEL_07010 [Paenibacillus stellifer]
MKIWIRSLGIVSLIAALLLPLVPVVDIPVLLPKAEAAGEVIEFNQIDVPALHLAASRPAPYGADDNWYAGNMTVDIPDFSANMKYNQVTGELHIDLSRLYLPTSWIINREPLGAYPKSPDQSSRWTHGYVAGFASRILVTYADGSTAVIANVGTGGSFDPPDTRTYVDATTQYTALPSYAYVDHFLADWEWYSYVEHRQITNSFSAYVVPSKKPIKIQFLQSFSDTYWVSDKFLNSSAIKMYNSYVTTDDRSFPLTTNKDPSLTLTSAPGLNIMNETGFSTYNLEGYVQDVDNDTLDVIAEIPNVFYKKISLSSTASPKNFIIPIDAITDSLSPGNYTINVKAVDPFNMKAEASSSITVTKRLKNKAFLLVNEPVSISGSYSDYENDPKYAERFKYDQDPSLFDNPMGLISDSGLWRTSKYTSFPYTGAYVASFQNRDNPLNDDRFDEFRKWSRDNLSSMTFLVHRRPIALFTARLSNGTVSLADRSYDLDHISAPSKGIYAWQWQYKKTSEEVWTEGQLSTLPSSDQYDIRLRVRDIDGPDGIGVWSDWYQVTVGSPSNLPPVALFTVTPNYVSHRKSTTITDQSFDPDNDPLDQYEWSVVKNGVGTKWYSIGSATTPPNIASYGVGSYTVTLKVHDNRGLWSNPYSQTVQVINSPPVAAFTMPSELYRDSVVAMTNLTPDPDDDDEAVSYSWNSRLNSSGYYYEGSNRNQNVSIRSLISQMGITDKQAVSDGWEMRLTASDGTLSSNATQLFTVLNHVPSAAINGSDTAVQYNSYAYTSADEDGDPSDMSSLQYYWKITDSDGGVKMLRTPNVQLTYNEPGVYTLEHWAVDQIGDKSNIASLKVTVAENQPPAMTLTSPPGIRSNPTIIDAEKEGDPLIKWNYSDPNGDPQEKYRLEFYTKDSLLAKTIENDDSTGSIRQYQMPNQSLERFLFYSVVGRAYSKNNWSEISNEKAFIIDNPPVPGFTLITDTGKDATKVPIYRTDVLQVESTAYDEDEAKGDTLSYQYYLKKSGGSEGQVNTAADFSKQFTSNGIFTYRQVVTDSLGLFREVIHALTVVNRLPAVSLTFPTSDTLSKPTISSTLTPIIKWSYSDPDGDEQQRFQVKIYDAVSSVLLVDSGEQVSAANQWKVPAGALEENRKYAVEVTVHDGLGSEGFGSTTSPRKYMLVNLLSVKGGVKHTSDWNMNRQNYNLKQTGDPESPRAYNVFWAGEKFVLAADATGLPDTIEVTMDGGFTTQMTVIDEDKKLWTGSLSDESFQYLTDGPITFTFTATNEYQTKTDKVTVYISGVWSDYFRNHRIK